MCLTSQAPDEEVLNVNGMSLPLICVAKIEYIHKIRRQLGVVLARFQGLLSRIPDLTDTPHSLT